MRILLTDSADVKTFKELGWNIRSFNFPIWKEELLGGPIDLIEVQKEEPLPGDINFVPLNLVKNIDMLTHSNLLEESLVNYKELWKTLAEK